MVFIWRIGGCGMSIGRLRQITYLGIIFLGIGIWYFIIMYPITTILSIIGSSIILGLFLKYQERTFRL
tara:strand:- start:660 stop:863 length:204 start_codon:yes stop_codon:yes gene_type:complete